jgi:hypothetical protein
MPSLIFLSTGDGKEFGLLASPKPDHSGGFGVGTRYTGQTLLISVEFQGSQADCPTFNTQRPRSFRAHKVLARDVSRGPWENTPHN